MKKYEGKYGEKNEKDKRQNGEVPSPQGTKIPFYYRT